MKKLENWWSFLWKEQNRVEWAAPEIADIVGINIIEAPVYTTAEADRSVLRNRRFQILLTDQILSELKQRSLETGLSCNEIVCQALSKYLTAETGWNENRWLWDLLISICFFNFQKKLTQIYWQGRQDNNRTCHLVRLRVIFYMQKDTTGNNRFNSYALRSKISSLSFSIIFA